MNDNAFLLLFIAFIALMGLIPFLLRKFGIPSVISLLMVGIIVGPTGIGLNLVSRMSEWLSFLGVPGAEAQTAINTASHFNSLVDSLGSLGLMFLMALAGMEADFKLIKSARKPVIALSIIPLFQRVRSVRKAAVCFTFCISLRRYSFSGDPRTQTEQDQIRSSSIDFNCYNRHCQYHPACRKRSAFPPHTQYIPHDRRKIPVDF